MEIQPAAGEHADAFSSVSADLVGFWKTQALCTAVDLELFDLLPASLENLAKATGAQNPQKLRRLLAGLAELGYVEKDVPCESSEVSEVWRAAEKGAFLQRRHPLTLADAAQEYGRHLTASWASLATKLSQDSSPSIFKEVAASRCASHHRMLQSYARHDYGEVPKVLRFLDQKPSQKPLVVLDVGGGTGTLSKLLLAEYPELEVVVLDLPEVLEQIEDPLPSGLRLCPVDLQSDWSSEAPCLRTLCTPMRLSGHFS